MVVLVSNMSPERLKNWPPFPRKPQQNTLILHTLRIKTGISGPIGRDGNGGECRRIKPPASLSIKPPQGRSCDQTEVECQRHPLPCACEYATCSTPPIPLSSVTAFILIALASPGFQSLIINIKCFSARVTARNVTKPTHYT